MLVAASPAFSLAYAAASAIRQGSRPPLATWLVAVVVGTITFLPAAFLFGWFAIAAILWLGLAGHAVPAIMAERLGPSPRSGGRCNSGAPTTSTPRARSRRSRSSSG